jgi:hypothetical protein
MSYARLAVIAVTILVWGLFVPVAMASSDCMAMCDGPCGVSADIVSAPVAPPMIALVTPAYVEAVSSAAAIDPRSPEPPPK